MKIRAFMSVLFLAPIALFADIDISDASEEAITPKAKPTPFHFEGSYDYIGPSKIRKPHRHKGEEIKFSTAEVEAGMVVYYCPQHKEGANVAFSYNPSRIKWENNPYFDQSLFNPISLSVGAVTNRFKDWTWHTQLSANWDLGKGCCSMRYFNYDILLWGRYALYENFGVHFGFWAETGMRMDRVYPVLGIDWQIARKWKLNLIFPLDMALTYDFNKKWTAALAGRLFSQRFRVEEHQPHAGWCVRYQNMGGEFALRYSGDTMTANLHAGYTFGGKYRIATPANRNAKHYYFDGAGYAGGEINVKF